MITLEQVLKLAQQLSAEDQARLSQIAHNQAAIALLDNWLNSSEEDDEGESWDDMLRTLDRDRDSTRRLYPELAVPPQESAV